jgi:hypothetical protein
MSEKDGVIGVRKMEVHEDSSRQWHLQIQILLQEVWLVEG